MFDVSPPGPALGLERFQDGMRQHFAAFRRISAPLDEMPASTERMVLILRIIQQLTEAEHFAAGFTAEAARLRDLGFSELYSEVENALRDVRNGAKLYAETYQNTALTLQRIHQVVGDAQDAAVRGQLESIARSRQAFDASMRGIIAVDEQSCQYCGLYFGASYGAWHWCPRCGAGF